MTDHETGIEAARRDLGAIVDRAAIDGEVTYLTRRGRRFAAVAPLNRIKDEFPVEREAPAGKGPASTR
jgi:antitoxin (DNA-binding transcriptional repressor) of toxin-antitoxin stability system